MKRLLALIMFAAVTTVSAGEFDYANKLGVGAGIKPWYSSEAGWALWNLHARYHINSAGAIAVEYTKDEFGKRPESAALYQAGYIHRFMPTERFTPTAGILFGAAEVNNAKDGNSGTKVASQLRGGLEYSLTYNLLASFTVDVRYITNLRHSLADSRELAILPQVNLTWFFGCGSACEKKESPKTAPVEMKKVESDFDKDGVVDSKDKCPNTPAGSKVNAYGCVPKEKAHVEVQVMFASSSSTLTSDSYRALDELAAFLKEHSNTKAEIQGHTDSSGLAAKNKVLSQQRADSVRNYLVNKAGIKADRLHAVGYGSDRPVADNKTVEGRTENRRVMAIIEE